MAVVGPAASPGSGTDEEEDAVPGAREDVAPGLLLRGRAVARGRVCDREDPRVRAVARDRGEAVVGPVASPGPAADEEDENAAPGARENPRVRAVD